MMKERLINDMKRYFGADQKRITHALSVLEYAGRIRAVEGGDASIVQAAAILHDIGIVEAQRKYGSTLGKYQETEGPPLARNILADYGLTEETLEHICRIIGSHHSGNDIDTAEFRAVWDADWLVNIPDDYSHLGSQELQRLVKKVFRTAEGRRLAAELFIGEWD